jgi:hypothetical protein
MEAIVTILVLIASLVALDVASFRWGSDSRPGMTDDHAR